MYWRFDEEEQYVELDYPRDLVMWRGIPYNIDAVFQWHDKKTYFFKEKYFWEFNDQRRIRLSHANRRALASMSKRDPGSFQTSRDK